MKHIKIATSKTFILGSLYSNLVESFTMIEFNNLGIPNNNYTLHVSN